LTFGNPERAEIGWELAQAIDGIAQAANELGIPVVSGNVSLYNETGGRPIPPTPVVGCVGLVPDVTRLARAAEPGAPRRRIDGSGADLVRKALALARNGAFVTHVRGGSEGAGGRCAAALAFPRPAAPRRRPPR